MGFSHPFIQPSQYIQYYTSILKNFTSQYNTILTSHPTISLHSTIREMDLRVFSNWMKLRFGIKQNSVWFQDERKIVTVRTFYNFEWKHKYIFLSACMEKEQFSACHYNPSKWTHFHSKMYFENVSIF